MAEYNEAEDEQRLEEKLTMAVELGKQLLAQNEKLQQELKASQDDYIKLSKKTSLFKQKSLAAVGEREEAVDKIQSLEEEINDLKQTHANSQSVLKLKILQLTQQVEKTQQELELSQKRERSIESKLAALQSKSDEMMKGAIRDKREMARSNPDLSSGGKSADEVTKMREKLKDYQTVATHNKTLSLRIAQLERENEEYQELKIENEELLKAVNSLSRANQILLKEQNEYKKLLLQSSNTLSQLQSQLNETKEKARQREDEEELSLSFQISESFHNLSSGSLSADFDDIASYINGDHVERVVDLKDDVKLFVDINNVDNNNNKNEKNNNEKNDESDGDNNESIFDEINEVEEKNEQQQEKEIEMIAHAVKTRSIGIQAEDMPIINNNNDINNNDINNNNNDNNDFDKVKEQNVEEVFGGGDDVIANEEQISDENNLENEMNNTIDQTDEYKKPAATEEIINNNNNNNNNNNEMEKVIEEIVDLKNEIEFENEKMKFEIMESAKRISTLEKEKLSLVNQLKRIETHNQTLSDQTQFLETLVSDLKHQLKADRVKEQGVLEEMFSIRERISYANKTVYARKMSEVLQIEELDTISKSVFELVVSDIKSILGKEGEAKLYGTGKEWIYQLWELLLNNAEIHQSYHLLQIENRSIHKKYIDLVQIYNNYKARKGSDKKWWQI